MESLPTLIHDALTASLEPGEQLYVAARAQGQDCLAVTGSRVFRMSVDGAGKLRSHCVPLTQVRDIEVEAGPLGGRLSWLERDRTDRVIVGFAGYDGGKFQRVAATMRQLASAAVGAESVRTRAVRACEIRPQVLPPAGLPARPPSTQSSASEPRPAIPAHR